MCFRYCRYEYIRIKIIYSKILQDKYGFRVTTDHGIRTFYDNFVTKPNFTDKGGITECIKRYIDLKAADAASTIDPFASDTRIRDFLYPERKGDNLAEKFGTGQIDSSIRRKNIPLPTTLEESLEDEKSVFEVSPEQTPSTSNENTPKPSTSELPPQNTQDIDITSSRLNLLAATHTHHPFNENCNCSHCNFTKMFPSTLIIRELYDTLLKQAVKNPNLRASDFNDLNFSLLPYDHEIGCNCSKCFNYKKSIECIKKYTDYITGRNKDIKALQTCVNLAKHLSKQISFIDSDPEKII
uniref:Uncharacterized protein n=1 Tax=Fomitiporia mediterranea TaxID=208960 RepID=A0A5B9RCG4_9AGAM|nr:hypothetical protein Fomme_000093 [Fomitiporia mediterranea]QEG57103.1 hypothetical protein Fomme_000093 [Fomitiporia mediterranea]